jgi:hypothetical protein
MEKIMPDEIDDLLMPSPSSPRDYSSLGHKSIIRRARRRTAIRWLGMISAMLLAGGIGWSVKPDRQTVIERSIHVAPANDSSTFVTQTMTADRFEQQAELSDEPAEIAKFYRLAGDEYLRQKNYPESERCYRLFVRTSRETQVQLTDSWLLQTVKQANPKG